MPALVTLGALLDCSMGVSPSSLIVEPKPTLADDLPLATINDTVPMTNIPSFGMCVSIANPQVATATAAAQGVLTPQPCIPVTVGPWAPPSTMVTVGGVPAVLETSVCRCMWAGVISVISPGQLFAEGT